MLVGRRVPTNKSVDNPTVVEVVEVCKKSGLTAELEVRGPVDVRS